MTEKVTGVCLGGPLDGKTVTGEIIMHWAFPDDISKNVHKYEFFEGVYHYRGERDVAKHGFDGPYTVGLSE